MGVAVQVITLKHRLPGGQHFRQQYRPCVSRGRGALFQHATILPAGEHGQLTTLPPLAAGRALQFATGGTGQGLGLQQQDYLGRDAEGVAHGFRDGGADHRRLDHPSRGPANFQGQPYAFRLLGVDGGKRGQPAWHQEFNLPLQGALDILGIQVLAIDDDDVLLAPRHVQVTVRDDAEVAAA